MEKIADTIETEEMPMLEEFLVTDDTPTDSVVIVEDPNTSETKEFDMEKNKDLKQFLNYLKKQIAKVPTHSGKTTAGCERAIAHFKNLDRMISKIIAEDIDCEIDDQAVEQVRKDLRKNIKKLQKRHNEINDAYDADDEKYASVSSGITKNADDKKYICDKCSPAKNFDNEEHYTHHLAMEHNGTDMDDDKVTASSCECHTKTAAPDDENCTKCRIKLWKAAEGLYECIACDTVYEKKIVKEAGTAKIQLVMNPFERAITGAIVNSFVSNGKNPEITYTELKKKYKFSDRDELSIQQILSDMGVPIMKDRGHIGDNSEQLNKGKGIEFATNYQA